MNEVDVNSLWYEGDAWCKSYSVDDLEASARPGSRFSESVRKAVARFDHRELISLLADSLLCAHMRESSNWHELNQGPWEPCQPREAVAIAKEIHTRRGCSSSERALEIFQKFRGPAFRLVHDYVKGSVLWDDSLCCFFFDAG